ncbi:LacI family transcriptional regulator [Paenibacillus doosanensis]|uniref:LacI family DNA-binding transcriptional regulator n=1 Tax=Paenibacillus doosanensis TaxID=1229154 RepID=UPI00217F454B|nr:LacI family DNA-binding transcriptional regulator [Paenibacillus doosanensis]MCS7463671.1 LacI family transcriptional regulator [Paenibacillus doosanensis]
MTKRVTSFDVAKRAGVSRSVVSAVLNGTRGIGVGEEKRKAVLEAIRELNYQVDAQARGMKTGRSQCLAAYGNVANPLFLQVLEGIQAACAACGYHVLLYPSGSSDSQRIEGLLDLFRQRRIDGVVALDRPHQVHEGWVQLVHENRLPYVSVEGYPDTEEIASVLMDYEESVRRALDYIAARTRQIPAYLELHHQGTPLGWGDRQRRNAYEDWMAERGWEPQVYTAADGPWKEREPFWREWLQRHRASSAILTNWSRGAVYVCRAAQLLGIQVGRELHVMASDNTERINQHMFPAITSTEVPYREMGRLAAKRLLEYIGGQRPLDDTSGIWVPAVLEERDSVGEAAERGR